MAAATKVSCFLCSSFAGSSFPYVVRHIGAIHSHDADFQVTCGLDACKKQYHNFGSYRVHLYREHHDIMKGWRFPEVSSPVRDEELLTDSERLNGESDDNNIIVNGDIYNNNIYTVHYVIHYFYW